MLLEEAVQFIARCKTQRVTQLRLAEPLALVLVQSQRLQYAAGVIAAAFLMLRARSSGISTVKFIFSP